ncbi:hypothetical protein A134_19730 [Vibrio crassostreae 9CS106]|nr:MULTISPECIES: EAL domain-containing protein [Vibrio]ANP78581.1 hypothetical protein A134_19730 [Vibrio crassostreae 9CS106]OED70366.1 hypothetical protein A141_11375 [Vibrio crassostreae ZF-91]
MRRETKQVNLSDHIIQEAFENDWHTCFYQPKVEPSIEKVTGVEALFRLDIPEEGIFSPGVFIDRAFDWVMKKRFSLVFLSNH